MSKLDRSWPHFDPDAEDGILSLDDLVHMFSMNFPGDGWMKTTSRQAGNTQKNCYIRTMKFVSGPAEPEIKILLWHSRMIHMQTSMLYGSAILERSLLSTAQ
jgi:hypothetical protein